MADGSFEERLRLVPYEWRGPNVDVADTMDLMRLWFVDHDIAFTAGDLVAVTRLVLEVRNRSNPTDKEDDDGD